MKRMRCNSVVHNQEFPTLNLETLKGDHRVLYKGEIDEMSEEVEGMRTGERGSLTCPKLIRGSESILLTTFHPLSVSLLPC